MFLAAAAITVAACSDDDRPATPIDSKEPPAVSPTQLFLAGDGELGVVDVDGETTRVLLVDQLAPGDPPYRIVRRGDRLVFYGGDTYSVDLALETAPRKVHDSWFFIPSSTDDRVWVAILDPESPDTVRALSAVLEVTADGHIATPPARPPGGRWPVGAVQAGLLLERERTGLDLWDPRRNTVVQRLPKAWPGPTQGNLLAWCAGGGPSRGASLHLTDVVSNTDRWQIEPPAGFAAFRCWDGAFAPNGRTFAVPIARHQDLSARHELALVDVVSGRSRVVPGSKVPAGYVFVTWTSSGKEVFLTGGQSSGTRRIVAYAVGEDRARVLDVKVPPFYGIAAS